MLQEGRVNVLIDGQWGSTGKGKLAGYLALRSDLSVVTSDFQTNAGHTWQQGEDKVVVRHLPNSLVNEDAMLLINPAATIDVNRLLFEIETYSKWRPDKRLMIHPHAGIVTTEDAQSEKLSVKRIASTMKGVGNALSRKVMRSAQLAKDEPRLAQWIGDTTRTMHGALRSGGIVLAESAQGFDLSLNHGHAYPYTTSRDVTTATILSNAGAPPQSLGNVYGCLRVYPIRVGNVIEDGDMLGFSGPCYSDHQERSWEEIQRLSGSPTSIEETTTVTGRVRRVFDWSWKQYDRFNEVCRPTHLFLNFVNHIDHRVDRCLEYPDLPEAVLSFVDKIEERSQLMKYSGSAPVVALLGTGPEDIDMIDRMKMV